MVAALGHAYVAEQRFKEAISTYGEAIAIDDKYMGAYLGRGWTNWFTGNPKAALLDYQKAIKLDPTNPTIYLELQRILLELGRPREVVNLWEQAVRLMPEWAGAREWHMYALEKIEDWTALQREIPPMLGLTPKQPGMSLDVDRYKKNPHLSYLLGRALNAAGQHKEAASHIENAVVRLLANYLIEFTEEWLQEADDKKQSGDKKTDDGNPALRLFERRRIDTALQALKTAVNSDDFNLIETNRIALAKAAENKIPYRRPTSLAEYTEELMFTHFWSGDKSGACVQEQKLQRLREVQQRFCSSN